MLKGYKTKIVGWCMFVIAVASVVKDLFDGGDFNFSAHYDQVELALMGLGFVTLRGAIKSGTVDK